MADASGASSSSAPSDYPFYDVFINHRGPDVKDKFASRLYRSLNARGLRVFLDKPEMQAGHSIPGQIEAAIGVASVQVAIFSRTYAQSKWCLDELVLMLNSGKTILPVFYKVKPSDLRYGAYAEELCDLEQKKTHDPETHQQKKPRYASDIIKAWRDALSRAADISGFELKDCYGDEERAEEELLDKVVQTVLKKIPKTLDVAKYPTGLGEKLQDFESKVLSPQEQKRKDAKVVGIVGVGGVGKTTLAKAFFNSTASHYNGSSYLSDVRERATRMSLNGLQIKLVKDLKGIEINIEGAEDGVGIIQKNLSLCHALIILDDVDHIDQLDAFLPIRHVLDPHSLIVVTSRDKHVLRSAGIVESSIYLLTGLEMNSSKELFCSYAFFQRHPRQGFENLVYRFLTACCGLPLSLKVFGALVCGHDPSYWEDQLHGLRQTQTLPTDIEKSLKISYDSLNHEEQQMFLDIACFSIGKDRDTWITIWGASRWKGLAGFRNLEDKCLVVVDSEKKILMHDHLRDLGRNIANLPGSMRRRLCGMRRDVLDLLEQSSAVMTEVRGIRMVHADWDERMMRRIRMRMVRRIRKSGVRMAHDRDERMVPFLSEMPLNGSSSQHEVFEIRKLRLLEVEEEDDFIKNILSCVRAPQLLWLCWKFCSFSSLPSWIPMHDLRGLEVDGIHLSRLWQCESQAPLQLRELNLGHALSLLEFPKSIGQLEHLQKIVVQDAHSLASLSEEFCYLRSLKYLQLNGCTNLQTLPNSFGNLTSLQHIGLDSFKKCKMLPDSFGNLTNLQHLDLRFCESLEMLPNTFGNLTNLQHLDVRFCRSLKMIPNTFGNLTNLQHLNLYFCKSLRMILDSCQNFTNLQSISLDGSENLPIESLLINIPFPCAIDIPTITLNGCTSLKILEFLINVRRINIYNCPSLKMIPYSFGNLSNLQEITIKGCTSLKLLPDSFCNLTNLQRINLEGCTSLEMLPNSIGRVRYLTVCNSPKLKCLPDSVGLLVHLKELRIWDCGIQYLPQDLIRMKGLRSLDVNNCPLRGRPFEKVGKKIRGTLQLRELMLKRTEISKLFIPDSVCPDLQYLSVDGCNNLVEITALPTALRMLDLRNCGALTKIGGLSNCTKLLSLDMRGCNNLQVEELPDVLASMATLGAYGAEEEELSFCHCCHSSSIGDEEKDKIVKEGSTRAIIYPTSA